MEAQFLDFPFHLDGRGRSAETGGDDHVRDLIYQVLFTNPGERVNRPDFGCGLTQFLFAPVDAAIVGTAEIQVRSGLQRWLGDVIGPRRVLTRIVLWWSAFTMLTGAAQGLRSLVAIRFLFGAGEAGAFPNAVRSFSQWFPARERGMANGVLVGVNPLYGLHAAMVGPLVGGIVSSTRLMVITTTAAASLTAGQSLVGVPEDRRVNALLLLATLAGAFQILFGVLGLARLTRFVSYSVTTGFLLGISVLLIVSQIPTIAGMSTGPSEKSTVATGELAAASPKPNVSAAPAPSTIALA